jgi:hypothetical protein
LLLYFFTILPLFLLYLYLHLLPFTHLFTTLLTSVTFTSLPLVSLPLLYPLFTSSLAFVISLCGVGYGVGCGGKEERKKGEKEERGNEGKRRGGGKRKGGEDGEEKGRVGRG